MPKRSRTPDANELAHSVVQVVIDKYDEGASDATPAKKPKAKRKNPAAVALGRKGGLKGGKARAASMTKAERSASARKAANVRWQSVASE
jgi:hypothetical protein